MLDSLTDWELLALLCKLVSLLRPLEKERPAGSVGISLRNTVASERSCRWVAAETAEGSDGPYDEKNDPGPSRLNS